MEVEVGSKSKRREKPRATNLPEATQKQTLLARAEGLHERSFLSQWEGGRKGKGWGLGLVDRLADG